MRILRKILAAVVLFFFATSTADIISVKIRSHNRDIILFSKFEFSHAGNVSVAVSSVGISSIQVTSNLSQPDPSRIGFFVLLDEFSDRYHHEFERNPDLCALDIKFISVLFTFRDLPPTPQASFNQSYHVAYPGEYSLYFANCNDLSLVTMDVRTELYNIADDGTTIDYLSAGQPQPSFYFKLFLIYLCFLGLWICVSLKNHKRFQRIHLLMGVLLVLTLLYFLCAAAYQHDLKVTGTRQGSWHALFYIFQFMRNVLFLTVIYLIGAGWCFWKPFLLGCDRYNLWIVILLQIWANVRLIAIGESGPYNEDWLDMILTFRVIDFVSCVVVMVHTVYSGNVASKEAQDKSLSVCVWSPSTTRRVVFGLSVSVYLLYSRAPPIQLEIPAALETGNLVFSMVMFYIYRPFLFENEDLNCKGFLDHTRV